jgi:hypothetical protein
MQRAAPTTVRDLRLGRFPVMDDNQSRLMPRIAPATTPQSEVSRPGLIRFSR